MLKISKNRFLQSHFFLALCLLFFCSFLLASPTQLDNQKKINIEADQVQFNSNTMIGYYQGHLKLIQGTRVLTADSAISYANSAGMITEIIAKGTPAHYEAQIFNHRSKLIATGNTIYYYPQKDLIKAVGNAQIIQGKNHFQGPQINYDFKNKTIASSSTKKERTLILLAPLMSLHS